MNEFIFMKECWISVKTYWKNTDRFLWGLFGIPAIVLIFIIFLSSCFHTTTSSIAERKDFAERKEVLDAACLSFFKKIKDKKLNNDEIDAIYKDLTLIDKINNISYTCNKVEIGRARMGE